MASTVKEAFKKTRFAMLSDSEKNNELWNVQYCPCGHVRAERRGDIVAGSDAGARDVAKIEAGRKLDAPIRHSSECPECKEEEARQERLDGLYYWDDLEK
jgi:hypothetical protein